MRDVLRRAVVASLAAIVVVLGGGIMQYQGLASPDGLGVPSRAERTLLQDNSGGKIVGYTSSNLDGPESVTATFRIASSVGYVNSYPVTAYAEGTGTGTVSSTPSGINFAYPGQKSGSSQFVEGTTVQLTAKALGTFVASWLGCPGTTAGNGTGLAICTIEKLDGPKEAKVKFLATQYLYSVLVTASGDAEGHVSSNPGGIDFDYPKTVSQSAVFPKESDIFLTANPTPSDPFDLVTAYWSACPGKQRVGLLGEVTCLIENLQANKSATVEFLRNHQLATVNATGDGTGSVSSDPPGLEFSYPEADTGTAPFPTGSRPIFTAKAA